MLIVALILFGIVIGAVAQLIVGRQDGRFDWPMACGSGLIGSFVGGLLSSLISGDGIAIQPSGVIGSIVGAIIVTLVWRYLRARQQTPA